MRVNGHGLHDPRSQVTFEKPGRILFHTAMSESAQEQRMLVALHVDMPLRMRERATLIPLGWTQTHLYKDLCNTSK